MAEFEIALLPGDGIGPEIVRQAKLVLEAVGSKWGHSFRFSTYLVGGAAIDELGKPITDETLAACQGADAVLLGAVGGPKWDRIDPAIRPEKALFGLRKGLGLFANLRPVKVFSALAPASSLKPDVIAGVDIMLVRELTGGLYFGEPRLRRKTQTGQEAVDTLSYTSEEILRLVRRGFELARGRKKKVTSVDKANVLATSQLWREITEKVAAEFPDVALEHLLVDNCAMQLVRRPSQFDVVVTENLFGDILSDEAAMLTGSIGMLPSASLGAGKAAMYEPIHGSAPDIAGQDKANPLATILSAAMMLRISFALEEEASAIEQAVEKVLAAGYRTADLYGENCQIVGTTKMGQLVLEAL